MKKAEKNKFLLYCKCILFARWLLGFSKPWPRCMPYTNSECMYLISAPTVISLASLLFCFALSDSNTTWQLLCERPCLCVCFYSHKLHFGKWCFSVKRENHRMLDHRLMKRHLLELRQDVMLGPAVAWVRCSWSSEASPQVYDGRINS